VLEVDEAQEDTHVVTRPTAIRGMPPVGEDGSGRATAIACGEQLALVLACDVQLKQLS
jgi:hypothetical protein